MGGGEGALIREALILNFYQQEGWLFEGALIQGGALIQRFTVHVFSTSFNTRVEEVPEITCISGFHGVKRLEVFPPPADGMVIHHRVTPSVPIYTPGWSDLSYPRTQQYILRPGL